MSVTPFQRVQAALAAIEKSASVADPSTSHPSGSAPDGTIDVVTGAHYAETTADTIKHNPRSPDALKGTSSPATPIHTLGVVSGDADADKATAHNFGLTPKYPPSAHPSGDGTKYSEWQTTDLVDTFSKLANAFLTDIASQHVQASPPQQVKAAAATASGYDFANHVVKAAQDQIDMAANVIIGTRKEAAEDADRVVQFLMGYSEKLAEEEMPEEAAEEKAPEAAPADTAGIAAALEEAGAPPEQVDTQSVLHELAQAMLEQGITPAQLVALVQGAQGGAPMAPPVADPMAMGAPPAIDPAMLAAAPPEVKAAMQLRQLARTPAFVSQIAQNVYDYSCKNAAALQYVTPPKTARAATVRESMRQFLREVKGGR